jgi:hypothetical protein
MADNNKNNKNTKDKPIEIPSLTSDSRTAAAYQTMFDSTARHSPPPEQCSPQNRHRGCRLSILQRCVNSLCDCTAGCRRAVCGTCFPPSAAAAGMPRRPAATGNRNSSSAPRSMNMDLDLRGRRPTNAEARAISAAASAAGVGLSSGSSGPSQFSIVMRAVPAESAARPARQGSASANFASPSPPQYQGASTLSAPSRMGPSSSSPAYVSVSSRLPEEVPSPPPLRDNRSVDQSPSRLRAESTEEYAGRDPFWFSSTTSAPERKNRVDAAVAALMERHASGTSRKQESGPWSATKMQSAVASHSPSPEQDAIKRIGRKTSLNKLEMDRSVSESPPAPSMGSAANQEATAQRRRRHSGSYPSSQRRPGTPRRPKEGASFGADPFRSRSPPPARSKPTGDYSPVVDRGGTNRGGIDHNWPKPTSSRSRGANPTARSSSSVHTGLPDDPSLRRSGLSSSGPVSVPPSRGEHQSPPAPGSMAPPSARTALRADSAEAKSGSPASSSARTPRVNVVTE